LRAVAECNLGKPEFTLSEKGEVPAIKMYEEQGLKPWFASMSCWQSKITPDMLPVQLAIVEVPATGSSEVVNNPHMRAVVIDWPEAPINCELIPNGEEAKKLPCQQATFSEPLRFFQFHSTGKAYKQEVVIRQ